MNRSIVCTKSLSTQNLIDSLNRVYRLTFAHLNFAALEIFARASADIVRFFTTLFPFKAAIAASTPANFLISVARSSWSILNRSVMGLPWIMFLEIL
jgi:hypothetical protein